MSPNLDSTLHMTQEQADDYETARAKVTNARATSAEARPRIKDDSTRELPGATLAYCANTSPPSNSRSLITSISSNATAELSGAFPCRSGLFLLMVDQFSTHPLAITCW